MPDKAQYLWPNQARGKVNEEEKERKGEERERKGEEREKKGSTGFNCFGLNKQKEVHLK